MMRVSIIVSVILAGLLSCSMVAPATAQGVEPASNDGERSGLSSDPDDPGNLLVDIRQRGMQRESLLPVSPLVGLNDFTTQAKDRLYEATGIRLGLAIDHLFQGLSRALPDEAHRGTTTDLDFIGAWELIDRGRPTSGQVYVGVEGRWDYGTTGPQTLGFSSLASAGGTANTFSAYTPTFIVRNLYWQHGSEEAGWTYRIGKITPDQILDSSAHISPTTTFLPNIGTVTLANALPDSGLGIAGAWFIGDRAYLAGLASDANGDRFDFGDIGAGDFYKAAELGVKIAPVTPKAGYSKVTLWHNDGTKDGRPSNGSAGKKGWGVFVKYEQELSADGRAVGVFRWGRSFDESALYEQGAGASFLLYDPLDLVGITNDLFGVAFNWVKSSIIGARDEYNAEVFYRFPIFPLVDMTLSYQSVIDPAFNPDFDHASAFSMRLRTTF